MSSLLSEFINNSIPVFLLKTRSVPQDGYHEFFTSAEVKGEKYAPVFVPVLEHNLFEDGMTTFRNALREKKVNRSGEDGTYGGAIFTSQRAVEAFAKVVNEEPVTTNSWPNLHNVPIYTVGPATSRALRAIPSDPPLQIFGEEAGNGAVLSKWMLGHYSDWHKELQEKNGCLPPLLFLVGKTRSDIIPKTLMSFDLPKKEQIIVDEVEVYETGVMESFEDEFTRYLDATKDNKRRWVVIFSPTGCEAALRALGWLDPVTKKATHPEGCRRTYIASIGPTTRDYLINQFGYQPDVCAEKPSPEGVGDAIEAFMANL